MPEPGTWVLAALACWCAGSLCFLAAGITVLNRTVRTRHHDQET